MRLQPHLAAFPAEPARIRVGGPHDDFQSVPMIFMVDDGRPPLRTSFSVIWRPAAQEIGLPSRRAVHALRHYYASLLIRHGESVKSVQARLGHATAAETLDRYSHLWPDSEDRTREAVDSVLGAADWLRTERGPDIRTRRSEA
jgi:integrase